MATNVDNILLSSTSRSEFDLVADPLRQAFKITNNGEVDWLLGYKVTRN